MKSLNERLGEMSEEKAKQFLPDNKDVETYHCLICDKPVDSTFDCKDCDTWIEQGLPAKRKEGEPLPPFYCPVCNTMH